MAAKVHTSEKQGEMVSTDLVSANQRRILLPPSQSETQQPTAPPDWMFLNCPWSCLPPSQWLVL